MLRSRGVTTLRHGACRGTDMAVARWVQVRVPDVLVEACPADWSHGRVAGPIRNAAMIDGYGGRREPASLMIHFRGGSGTADCTARAIEAGVPVEWMADYDEMAVWSYQDWFPPKVADLENLGLGMEFRGPDALRMYKRWLWKGMQDPRSSVSMSLRYAYDEWGAFVSRSWPHPCAEEVAARAIRWMLSGHVGPDQEEPGHRRAVAV